MVTFSKLRKDRGLTQAKIAKALNIDQSTVSLWEKGKTAPRMDVAFKLANLMQCSLDDIFKAIRASGENAEKVE